MDKKQFASHLRPLTVLFTALLITMIFLATSTSARGAGEDAGMIYKSRPSAGTQQNINCIGATGIKARIYKGLVVKVEGLIENSPADGKF